MRVTLWTISIIAFVLTLASVAYGLQRGQTLRRVAKSTVVINTDRHSTGSGTVIGNYGNYTFVLTCNHVVADATHFVVHATGDVTDIGTATILKTDEDHDLAILLVLTRLRAIPLRLAAAAPLLYDSVYIVGNAFNKAGTASEAIISDKAAHDDMLPAAVLWRITGGYVYYGVSGGTAVNRQGELVCVPNMIELDERGVIPFAMPQMGYCIPLEYLKPFVQGYEGTGPT